MVSIFSFAVLLFCAFLGSVIARNGCRRCAGYYSFYLDTEMSEIEARAELHKRLGICATGGQYEAKPYRRDVCLIRADDTLACNYWKFQLDIYRYCGNGGKVWRANTPMCRDGECFYKDKLQLWCNNSVDCAGTCVCSTCAC